MLPPKHAMMTALRESALADLTLTDASDLGIGDVFPTLLPTGERTHVYVTGPAIPVVNDHGYDRFALPVRVLGSDIEDTITFGPGGFVMRAALTVTTARNTEPQDLVLA